MKLNVNRLEKVSKIEIKKSIRVASPYSKQPAWNVNGGCQVSGSFEKSFKESRIAQEKHHAMHALMFFYIAIYGMLKGKALNDRLLNRLVHHLMDLREFINGQSLSDLVNRLLTSLRNERSIAIRRKQVINIEAWITKNLDAIMDFARRYGRRALFNGLLKMGQNNNGSAHLVQGGRDHA